MCVEQFNKSWFFKTILLYCRFVGQLYCRHIFGSFSKCLKLRILLSGLVSPREYTGIHVSFVQEQDNKREPYIFLILKIFIEIQINRAANNTDL